MTPDECLARTNALNPSLNAVLAINPDARQEAPGILAGMPILLKDNIETKDPIPTTAGSLALLPNFAGRDATIVARLRAAGGVILGKTNLSEWANMRGARSVSGWSGVGGLTRNPWSPDRSACGSSAGSAAAVAAGMVPAAIGTETDGSITCPASVNGIVGFKPTLGLVSRHNIIPLAHSQDTPGPMTASVRDAALILGVIAGSDPADPATRAADGHRQDYLAALQPDALAGRRIGVMRFAAGFHPETDLVFARALQILRQAGATLIEIAALPGGADAADRISAAENIVLLTELKAGMAAYLATTPAAVTTRTLADLIAFNTAHAARVLGLFGQELFEAAEATAGLTDPVYLAARAASLRMAGSDGIDRMLAEAGVAALVAPSCGPAWLIDTIAGSGALGRTSLLPAVAGTPHLSVPMGLVSGLPVGLSIIGPAWSDALVLALGHGFEQARGRFARPRLAAILPSPGLLLPARDGRSGSTGLP